MRNPFARIDTTPIPAPVSTPVMWLPLGEAAPVLPIQRTGVWDIDDVSHDDARVLRAEDAERAMGLL